MHNDLPAAAGHCSFSELQFDSLCQQFIRGWRTSAHVAIEQLLAENCDLPRAELLARLLEQEFRLSRASGEQVELADYLQRFNDESAVIRAWNASSLSAEARDLPPTSILIGDEDPTAQIPVRVGHFSIRRLLGRGSFGNVYLAHDPSSRNEVAIKVPHRSAIKSARQLEDFLQEAQTGEHLDHPNLVRTLSVQEADGHPVIVQQYIDGQNLAQWCEQSCRTPEQVARLLVPVAEALGYLHQRGVFHRDLKPGNILVDRNDRAYVADFGLALHETQQRNRDRRGEIAGTYAYMAPEQFLGESQLIDGQSDIWSFGVILYRLLTDRYPFGGPPPLSLEDQSDYFRDLKFEIREHDPRPPRQINPAISRRLEQICMRCLEKRKRDRYQTAYDLAEDLELFLNLNSGNVAGGTPNHQIRIVPKGLRSFDGEDAAFFLDLLPGARTLEGIPTSLSFWKSRLLGAKGDVPIEVGVVYGPSGCGKSSFVKAGLLPLIGDSYVSLLVESTPVDTEVRALRAMRCALPDLPQGISLSEACHWIAEGNHRLDQKVLLVLDQFEQWLYAHPNPADEDLTKALRNSNGTDLQVLLLVRDDFWMPLTRFMERLEIPLQESNNAAAIDLFDIGHARTVLVALGQAYGRLPIDAQQLTSAQQQFVSNAVEGLADDHRVYCVRLALFAEMMKDRPWTPMELDRVGGAKGVGVAFLEEKFGPNGPLAYRPHQLTIRRILAALLPSHGSTMKGQMKTLPELQESSGGESEPTLKRLLHSLDTDLRLLTPVVVDESSSVTSSAKATSSGLAYQLTHDYLVPSIREWLTRKQRETWRGRCELRLEERTSLWSVRPEPKQLPSLWETLQITLTTRSANWTPSQSKLMQQAQRRHGRRLALVGAVLVLLLLCGTAWHRSNVAASRRRNVDEQLERLLLADIDRLPHVLKEMKPTYGLWRDQLRRIAEDGSRPVEDRLRAELALIPHDRSKLEALLEHASTSDLQTLEVVRGWLSSELAPSPANDIWRLVRKDGKSPSEQLRLAVLLAEFDPQSTARWDEVSEDITEALLKDGDSVAWVDQLLPVGRHLAPALAAAFLASQPHSLPRQTSAHALAKLGGTETLCRVLVDADDSQIELFVGVLSQDQEQAARYLHSILTQLESDPSLRLQHTKRQRASCLALMLLGREDLVWPQLESSADPSLRTELILSLNANSRIMEALLRGEETVRDAGARQAIWLAMGGTGDKPSPEQMQKVAERLSSRLPAVDNIAERAAMTWLAQHCELSTISKAASVPASGGRDWFVNSQGTTFAEFRGPVEFFMGSLDDEPRRDGSEVRHVRRIDRDFAVAVHEVTVSEYRRFQPGYSPDPQVGPTSDCPASSLSWLDAAKYCRWLSEQEHVPEDQMCYPPVDEIQDNMSFAPNLVERTGYRLPTEAEWEFVCRGGTTSEYFFGENEQLANRFAWILVNSGEVTLPVGQLRPNVFGLFDIQGNVHEWCQDAWEPYPVNGEPVLTSAAEINSLSGSGRVIRGAMYRSGFRPLRSAFRQAYPATAKFSTLGFRLARTISGADDQTTLSP